MKLNHQLIKWEIQEKETLKNMKLFTLFKHKCYHPGKKMEHSFYVLDVPAWINVIPLTKNNEVVMIYQYRAGIDDFTLEIPGGMMDKEDLSPTTAGVRELTEETGYVPTHTSELGYVLPNPAIQNNRCYFILATGCELKSKTNFDHAEDIETQLIPVKNIPELMQSNKITHALVQCAFQKLFLTHPELL